MPTATARGNITSETPVLPSLVGPDDVVPATHQQRRAFGDGACSPMACKKRRALETPSHAAPSAKTSRGKSAPGRVDASAAAQPIGPADVEPGRRRRSGGSVSPTESSAMEIEDPADGGDGPTESRGWKSPKRGVGLDGAGSDG